MHSNFPSKLLKKISDATPAKNRGTEADEQNGVLE